MIYLFLLTTSTPVVEASKDKLLILEDTLILLHAEMDKMKKVNDEHIPQHFYLHLARGIVKLL